MDEDDDFEELPRVLTDDEVRDNFLRHCRDMVHYLASEDRKAAKVIKQSLLEGKTLSLT